MLRRKCRLPYLRHASFGRWRRTTFQPAQRAAERCEMRRYVRSRCSWALLYHSQVPFRPGFSRTATYFLAKQFVLAAKETEASDMVMPDGKDRPAPLSTTANAGPRCEAEGNEYHTTASTECRSSKTSKRNRTNRRLRSIFPYGSTNQARAPEHDEAGRVARLRFSFNLFVSF